MNSIGRNPGKQPKPSRIRNISLTALSGTGYLESPPEKGRPRMHVWRLCRALNNFALQDEMRSWELKTCHIFDAIAEFERDLFGERTNAELSAVRTLIRKGGMKPILTDEHVRFEQDVRHFVEDALPGSFRFADKDRWKK